MLACWVENPEGDHFKKHLSRISDYLWVAEDGMKMQVKKFKYTHDMNVSYIFFVSQKISLCRFIFSM